MRRVWRRYWPLALLAVVGSAVATVHLAVEWLTREPPNYSQIEEGLWLGGSVPEPPSGTRAVLNLCEAEDPYRVESYRWEPIRDAEPAPTMAWLREQVAFVDSERAAGRAVFVHCRNGVSRSAMVMAAYLMHRENWSRDQAIEHLRQRRPGVRPNPAFLPLLKDWERSLGIVPP